MSGKERDCLEVQVFKMNNEFEYYIKRMRI